MLDQKSLHLTTTSLGAVLEGSKIVVHIMIKPSEARARTTDTIAVDNDTAQYSMAEAARCEACRCRDPSLALFENTISNVARVSQQMAMNVEGINGLAASVISCSHGACC